MKKTMRGLFFCVCIYGLLFLSAASGEEMRLEVKGGERTFYRGGQEYILAECRLIGAEDPSQVSWDLLLDAANDPVIALEPVEGECAVTVYLQKDGLSPKAGDYAALLRCTSGDFSDWVMLSATVTDAPMGPLWELTGIEPQYALKEGEVLTVRPGTEPAGWQIPGEGAVVKVEAVTTELGQPCGEDAVEVWEEDGSLSVRFRRGGIYLVRYGMDCANFHLRRLAAVTVTFADGSAPVSELPDSFHLEEKLIFAVQGEPFRVAAYPSPEGIGLNAAVVRSEIRVNGVWHVLAENGMEGEFAIDTLGIYPCMYRATIGTAVYETPFNVVCSPEGGVLPIANLTVQSAYPASAAPGSKMGNGFFCQGYMVTWTISAYKDGELVDEQQGSAAADYTPVPLSEGEWLFVIHASDALGQEKTAQAQVHVGGRN